MGGGALSRFAERLQRRIRSSGFSNVSALLKSIGVGPATLSHAKAGGQTELGLMKVARIATILGVYPSEVMRDLDTAFDNPPKLEADDYARLGLSVLPEGFDALRFAIIVDVVLDWVAERGIREADDAIGAQCMDLYAIVQRDPAIDLVRLRQQVFAIMVGIDIPTLVPTKRRG